MIRGLPVGGCCRARATSAGERGANVFINGHFSAHSSMCVGLFHMRNTGTFAARRTGSIGGHLADGDGSKTAPMRRFREKSVMLESLMASIHDEDTRARLRNAIHAGTILAVAESGSESVVRTWGGELPEGPSPRNSHRATAREHRAARSWKAVCARRMEILAACADVCRFRYPKSSGCGQCSWLRIACRADLPCGLCSEDVSSSSDTWRRPFSSLVQALQISSGRAHPPSKRSGSKLSGFTQRRERRGSSTGSLRRRKGSSGYLQPWIRGRKRIPSELLTGVLVSVAAEMLMMGGTLVTVKICAFSSAKVWGPCRLPTGRTNLTVKTQIR